MTWTFFFSFSLLALAQSPMKSRYGNVRLRAYPQDVICRGVAEWHPNDLVLRNAPNTRFAVSCDGTLPGTNRGLGKHDSSCARRGRCNMGELACSGQVIHHNNTLLSGVRSVVVFSNFAGLEMGFCFLTRQTPPYIRCVAFGQRYITLYPPWYEPLWYHIWNLIKERSGNITVVLSYIVCNIRSDISLWVYQ